MDKGEKCRVEREGTGDTRVLLIPPMLERNTDTFFRTLAPEVTGVKDRFTFYSIKPIPRRSNGTVNYRELLERCRDVITAEGISVLYSNKQAGNLVQAVLTSEFPHMRGPSVESVFLCNHKYYTTTTIDSRATKLPYYLLDLEEETYDATWRLLQEVPAPCIVRACVGSGHSVYCFHNRDQLLKVMEKCRKDIPHIVDMQRHLLERHVSRDRYPLGLSHVVLVNPYLDRFSAVGGAVWSSVSIEAAVWRGEIVPWAVCDVITLPYGTWDASHYFSGYEMPSRLTARQGELLWAEFSRDIRALSERGFDNGFLYGEYMVFRDGSVHLVTMTTGPHAKCTHMYRRALRGGNNIEAALQLGRGVKPQTPTPTGQYVLNYSMFVFESGKADNVIKFEAALEHPDVVLRYLPGQDIMIEPAKDYALIGFITVSGENFQQCIEKIKNLREKVLKTPQLVPLTC